MEDYSIDLLHYELLKLQRYVPHYTKYLANFKHKNKFLQAFIRHKVQYISYICDALLINSSGRCDWKNINEINKRGFYVGPGETDSFGWVTGILETSKGIIVYG